MNQHCPICADLWTPFTCPYATKETGAKRWKVCKRGGRWRVLDRNVWSDVFETLEEAHTYATQCAVSDVLYQSGGLTLLAELRKATL